MNYRSIADLNDCLIAGLAKVPRDVDLIVGVPRSGMLPATMLALHLNVALTDVDGLISGKLMQHGVSRDKFQRIRDLCEAKKILVIDDSCLSGKQMQIVRDRINTAGIHTQVLYAVVYVAPEARQFVDMFFEVCPTPRMFEWNIMHHPWLQQACMDIDGVLCSDPTDEENDDGVNYSRFLDEAKPMWIPTVPVGWLVTSRLEKYRAQTEHWLARHNIKYGELIMLNMKSAAERRAAGCHGKFKGEVYSSKPAEIFIESNPSQSREIAELACKAVFCTEDRQVYMPSDWAAVGYMARKLPARAPRIAWKIISAIRRRIAF
jgi:uncharacterized HAD superfamily protein/hypoxanthine phosphoribosyltransferase